MKKLFILSVLIFSLSLNYSTFALEQEPSGYLKLQNGLFVLGKKYQCILEFEKKKSFKNKEPLEQYKMKLSETSTKELQSTLSEIAKEYKTKLPDKEKNKLTDAEKICKTSKNHRDILGNILIIAGASTIATTTYWCLKEQLPNKKCSLLLQLYLAALSNKIFNPFAKTHYNNLGEYQKQEYPIIKKHCCNPIIKVLSENTSYNRYLMNFLYKSESTSLPMITAITHYEIFNAYENPKRTDKKQYYTDTTYKGTIATCLFGFAGIIPWTLPPLLKCVQTTGSTTTDFLTVK